MPACADYVADWAGVRYGDQGGCGGGGGAWRGCGGRRALTTKPLVAIGGITRENARSVMEAGADSVAVISGLFGDG